MTVMRACVVGESAGLRKPSICRIIGTRNKLPTTSALTGFPGNPIAGVPWAEARMVGFPGRMAIPWTSTPGSPREAITSAVDGTDSISFILRPTPPGAVAAVARAGERMPQKSTYFYPKVASGFAMRLLR